MKKDKGYLFCDGETVWVASSSMALNDRFGYRRLMLSKYGILFPVCSDLADFDNVLAGKEPMCMLSGMPWMGVLITRDKQWLDISRMGAGELDGIRTNTPEFIGGLAFFPMDSPTRFEPLTYFPYGILDKVVSIAMKHDIPFETAITATETYAITEKFGAPKRYPLAEIYAILDDHYDEFEDFHSITPRTILPSIITERE